MMPNILYSSINSTDYDYARNRGIILQAIEAANKNEVADLHIISALPITGPMAQGYNGYMNSAESEEEIIDILQDLVKHTQIDTLISFPWFHRDPTVSASHPFYKSSERTANRPFYATAIVKQGKIVAVNLESTFEYLEGGPYDSRYFASWPTGLIETVDLGNGPIPVGNIAIEIDAQKYLIAATPAQAREHAAIHCDDKKLTGIILNSAGFFKQEEIEAISEETVFKDLTLVSGNPLGTDSGDKVGSGELFIYRNGQEIYRTPGNEKYSFSDSVTQQADLSAPTHQATKPSQESIAQDIIDSSTLWLRDYLLKTKQQGYVLSLSDGINSAYTAVLVSQSIDRHIQACAGVRGFFDDKHFGFLECKKEVLALLNTNGEADAIALLKKKMLSFVYMPLTRNENPAELAQMKALTDALGGSFHVSEVGNILVSNFNAISEGILREDKDKLLALSTNKAVIQAALERAQTTESGMYGNIGSKICLSTANVQEAALGYLHAGGKGQEGPVSVTIPLYASQIVYNLKHIAKSVAPAASQAIADIIASSKNHFKPGHAQAELILDQMIFNKLSPLETYHQIKATLGNNPKDIETLVQNIDLTCDLWGYSQPSRVALTMSPNLGKYARNVDRYRSARNTRDNQYFNNGRIELRLHYLSELGFLPNVNLEYLLTVSLNNKELRDYLLNNPLMALCNPQIVNVIQGIVDVYEINDKIIKDNEEDEFDFSFDNAPHTLNIGAASLHQTMFDYANNVDNIKAAIKHADANSQDVLLLNELVLTGYFGDGDFDWINNEAEGAKIFQQLINIAKFTKNSDVVVSLGLPVFIAPHKRPFNGQALIHRGKVISISLKTTQPDGNGEWEAMHFTSYDTKAFGTVRMIKIPGQQEPVVVGKPVTVVMDKNGYQFPIVHEQCAEGWDGIYDDGTVNKAVQEDKRYLYKIANKYPGLLVLNPSGSKNEVKFDKSRIRENLARTAFERHPNLLAYAYANVAGDDNGTIGGDADTFIMARDANNALTIHHGYRHSLAQHSAISTVVALPEQQLIASGHPTIVLNKSFNMLQPVGQKTGYSSPLELTSLEPEKRKYNEIIRTASAWVLNTLRHHKKQSFIISLSGGADSTFGAVEITLAVDLFIQEHTLRGLNDGSISNAEIAKQQAVRELFKYYFAHLHCKNEILANLQTIGADEAIKRIKNHILVCVYMPTANSSKATEMSARTLIEGGPQYKITEDGRLIKPLTEDGPPLKGIGGRFMVVNLQKPMEEFITSFSGKTDGFEEKLFEHATALKSAYEALMEDGTVSPALKAQFTIAAKTSIEALYNRFVIAYSEKQYKPMPEVVTKLFAQSPPTWFEPKHDLTKQNLQPRLRSICPWVLADVYQGYPLFTSNLSESIGYSTWAGDTSLGYENILGEIPKSELRIMLTLLEKGELCQLKPISGLYYVNHLIASAELRPLGADEHYDQTDEADLMPYDNLDKIYDYMILQKYSPLQTYGLLEGARNTKGQPMFKNDGERAAQIHKLCWLFSASQFKRTGGGNTVFMGRSPVPHHSLETTLLSERLTTGRVELNVTYLEAQIGSETLKMELGMTAEELVYRAKVDASLRKIIIPIILNPVAVKDSIRQWKQDQSNNPASTQAGIHYSSYRKYKNTQANKGYAASASNDNKRVKVELA